MNKSYLIPMAILGGATMAHADDFDFSWISPSFTANGVLSGTNNMDGTYTITSGSMVVTADATGDLTLGTPYALIPAGTPGHGEYAWDSVLIPGSDPQFTASGSSGILFGGLPDGEDINIYNGLDGNTYFSHSPTVHVDGSFYNPGEAGKFSTQAVPEPVSIVALGLGGLFFRRRKSA
jgi:hypothetical protein